MMLEGALWCSSHEFGQLLTKFNGVPHLRRDSRYAAFFGWPSYYRAAVLIISAAVGHGYASLLHIFLTAFLRKAL
jgi:hypothetical protein